MKLKLLGLIFVVFIAACSDGGSSSGGSGEKEQLILALGDSIGAGSFTGGYAYPEITSIQTAIPVVNASVPGINAENAVSEAQRLIDQHNPQFLIAMLGTNNALGSGGGGGGAVNALQSLANICEANGVICIISTVPPITRSSNENGNVNNINAGIFGISNAVIVDSNAVLTSNDILSDGIHPSGGGQDKIAAIFSAALIEFK